MFSGLTNQVSTWMAKKDGNGKAIVPEEKAGVSAEEAAAAELPKETSPTKGRKLDMFMGVKSQMSGWLGGIPGLNRGAGAGEGEGQEVLENPPAPVAPAGGEDVEKEDDRSSATGGADSNPGSTGGTPTEDAAGQQAFGGVSTKAIAGAKSLGGFLYSAVNKAGKSVVEAGVKIKKTVEENKLITEMNREQDAFIASKQNGSKGEAVAPWVGAPNEDVLREECLSLSSDQRNFLRAPPEGVEFEWNFEAIQPVAKATLALDPNLEKMRFELVPKVISEEMFWRNYFYRVSLLRQSHELNAMASNNMNENSGSVDKAEVQVTNGQEASGAAASSCSNTLADSPGHEFVSDSMRVSDTDLEEVRQGMKKLGMQPPKEDWERELEAELKDYEVVTSGDERSGSGGVATPGGKAVALDKDDWEKQIDELLANEEDEDLK